MFEQAGRAIEQSFSMTQDVNLSMSEVEQRKPSWVALMKLTVARSLKKLSEGSVVLSVDVEGLNSAHGLVSLPGIISRTVASPTNQEDKSRAFAVEAIRLNSNSVVDHMVDDKLGSGLLDGSRDEVRNGVGRRLVRTQTRDVEHVVALHRRRQAKLVGLRRYLVHDRIRADEALAELLRRLVVQEQMIG